MTLVSITRRHLSIDISSKRICCSSTPGVVHQDRHSTETGLHCVEESHDISLLRDIGLEGGRADTTFHAGIDRRLRGDPVGSEVHGDIEATFCGQASGRRPDAAAASGDHDDSTHVSIVPLVTVAFWRIRPTR